VISAPASFDRPGADFKARRQPPRAARPRRDSPQLFNHRVQPTGPVHATTIRTACDIPGAPGATTRQELPPAGNYRTNPRLRAQ
jgi:hypothetical protein